MKQIMSKLKKDPVLVIAILLALVSGVFVPPDKGYIDYIDYKVLVLLFCLMAVVAGFNKVGVFSSIGKKLAARFKTERGMYGIIIVLCFFSSMMITNDVALITFVPFTIVLAQKKKPAKLIQIIVLETLAANLGSMLTPIGNPQNLYLYSLSGMDVLSFIKCMLPLVLIAALLIGTGIMMLPKTASEAMEEDEGENFLRNARFWVYMALFWVCLLNVFHVIDYPVVLIIVVIAVLCCDRTLFKKVDYALLITFVGFFIFVGNIKEIDVIREFLQSIISGRELVSGALISQVISNVPAAMLMSGFTTEYEMLLWGVNMGGLGTIIASMASLISYKYYCNIKDSNKGKYMLQFTIWNVIFLGIMLTAAFFLV